MGAENHKVPEHSRRTGRRWGVGWRHSNRTLWLPRREGSERQGDHEEGREEKDMDQVEEWRSSPPWKVGQQETLGLTVEHEVKRRIQDNS